MILPPFEAFAIGQCIIRSAGFISLFLLLTQHVLPEFGQRRIVAAGASVAFALLPYWDFGGTVVAFPLSAYALMNLVTSRSLTASWCILVLIPFIWTFQYGGFAIVVGFAAAAAYGLLNHKAYWRKVLLATFLMAGIGAAFEYRTIWLLLWSGFVPSRVEWDPYWSHGSIREFLVSSLNNVIFGQYHFYSGQFPIPLLAIGLALGVVNPWVRGGCENHVSRLFLWVLAVSLIVSIIFAGEESGLTKFAFWLPIPFQISYINSLHPPLIQIAFALSVTLLCLRFPAASNTIALSFVGLIATQAVLTADSLGPKITDMLGIPRIQCDLLHDSAYCYQTQISRYYRSDQYQSMAIKIGKAKDTYWVVSLGLDPMIAAFNGFQTLDGYAPMYSLAYKHRFERIVAKELDRNKAYSDYFRKWGNRAYLFHSPGMPILIDFCQASSMGAEYVLSSLSLDEIPAMKLLASVGEIRAYEIVKEACNAGVERNGGVTSSQKSTADH